jgi:hypothetical protein
MNPHVERQSVRPYQKITPMSQMRPAWNGGMLPSAGGDDRSGQLIPALVELCRQSAYRSRLVRCYETGDIEQTLPDSKSGRVIKPILRMSDVCSESTSNVWVSRQLRVAREHRIDRRNDTRESTF